MTLAKVGKLLTKVRKSPITDVAGLLDTPSKIKLPKNINRNITKQKKLGNQRKPDFNFFLRKKKVKMSIKIYFGLIITIIFIYYYIIIRVDILKTKFFNMVRS